MLHPVCPCRSVAFVTHNKQAAGWVSLGRSPTGAPSRAGQKQNLCPAGWQQCGDTGTVSLGQGPAACWWLCSQLWSSHSVEVMWRMCVCVSCPCVSSRGAAPSLLCLARGFPHRQRLCALLRLLQQAWPLASEAAQGEGEIIATCRQRKGF